MRLFLMLALICLIPFVGFGQKGKKKKKKAQIVEEVSPKLLERRDMLFVEAATQRMLGDLENALLNYDEVLKIDPAHHASHYEKSRIFLEKQAYLESIKSAEAALKGDATNYWYHKQHQEAYIQQGNYKKAVEIGETIVSRFSEKYDDLEQLADLSYKLLNTDKAISFMEQASRRPGGNEKALNTLIDWQWEADKKNEAIQSVDRLIELNPSNAAAYKRKIAMLGEAGRGDEAGKSLKAWLKRDPYNPQAQLLVAEIAPPKEALSLIKKAYSSERMSIQEKLAVLTSNEIAISESNKLELIDILKAQYGDEPDLQTAAGTIFLANEKYTEAAQSLRLALKDNPASGETWQALLQADLAGLEYATLKKDAEEALELYPNSQEILSFYGIGALRSGDKGTAEYVMNKLSRVVSANPLPIAAMFVYSFNGNIVGTSNLEEEGKSYMGSIKEAYEQAKSASKEDHVAGKVLALFTALESNPILNYDPEFLTMYGHAAKKAGNESRAQTLWNKARKYGATDPEKAL